GLVLFGFWLCVGLRQILRKSRAAEQAHRKSRNDREVISVHIRHASTGVTRRHAPAQFLPRVLPSVLPSGKTQFFQDVNGVSGTGVSGGLPAAQAAMLSTTSWSIRSRV